MRLYTDPRDAEGLAVADVGLELARTARPGIVGLAHRGRWAVLGLCLAEESARGRPGFVNLIGIDSPGLTSSPAIAEHVARMVEGA